MITLALQAETIEELRVKLRAILDQTTAAPEPVRASPEPAATKVIREAKAKAKAAEKAPEPEERPVEEEPEVAVEEPELVGAGADLKELLMIKDRTISVLQQALADGKIAKLRKLLADYGGGAKSFPEVAIEQFPKIDKAVQAGALV